MTRRGRRRRVLATIARPAGGVHVVRMQAMLLHMTLGDRAADTDPVVTQVYKSPALTMIHRDAERCAAGCPSDGTAALHDTGPRTAAPDNTADGGGQYRHAPPAGLPAATAAAAESAQTPRPASADNERRNAAGAASRPGAGLVRRHSRR